MNASCGSASKQNLQWYLGRDDVAEDSARVLSGGPLALVGGQWDDLVRFADRIASERPVIDLSVRTPSARELRELYAAHPDTIVLAHRQERVASALGVIAQPWCLLVKPLTARPQQALSLLRVAVAQLGVEKPLEAMGGDVVAGLDDYDWPRGLHEIREASWRVAAVLESGNISAAARRLDISRQAVSKYLNRRIA